MHISYRHSEPEVVISDDTELGIVHDALVELRKVKFEALNALKAQPDHPEFTERCFGIDKIDAMLAALTDVL